MKITATNNTNYNPIFGAWKRTVYKDMNKWTFERVMKHRNDTWFCRDGFNDGAIFNHVMEKFKDVDKVNTYFWGCSNGCEVYTFLNELFAKSDKNTINKFTPIHAIDYDPVAIMNANHSVYPVEDHEILKLEECHGQKITENFYVIYDAKNSDTINCIIPKQKLRVCVDFRLGDITKDCSKMKSKNNLVFARNMWPYLELNSIFSVAKNLYNKMGENSLLIIGEYDPVGLHWNGINADFMFTEAGFKPTDYPLIYEK